MSENLALTRCKICEHVMSLQPSAGLLNMPPGQKLTAEQRKIAYDLMQLAQHMVEKHPRVDNMLEAHSLAYKGLLRMAQFRIGDQVLQRQRDIARWQVKQQMLPYGPRISDENINVKSREFAVKILDDIHEKVGERFYSAFGDLKPFLETGVAEQIAQLVTFIRNELEERGKYETQSVSLVGA